MEDSGDTFLNPHGLVKADVLQELVKRVVVVSDGSLIWGLVVVLLQDAVSHLRVYRKFVDVHYGKIPGLLLGDAEDVSVETGPLYPHEVRVALSEVASEDKQIAHPVHPLAEVLALV